MFVGAAPICDPYWGDFARSYHELGPPLKPCDEDIRRMEEETRRHAEEIGARTPQALVLGVTPKIVNMRWPNRTALAAVDACWEIIQALWVPAPGNRQVLAASWLSLPLETGSIDMVLGDGSLNCVRYPDDVHAAAQEVKRVLRPD